jgi:hypothetical protein
MTERDLSAVSQRRKDIAMSVATQLGLSDPNQDLLVQARQQWPTWCRHYPGLAVVEDLLDLPSWLKEAEKSQADDVLHTLATMGSPRGGDDIVAAGALAWLLLPGVCLVAHRLRSLTNRIDEVVAAQLWLEVRGFPWERLHKVAANIVMNTRRGVLRELGVGECAREADPTWARSVPVEPSESEWWLNEGRRVVPESTPANMELAQVLTWAVRAGVIDNGDLDLLISLAIAADEIGVTRSGRGQGGLCSRRVAQRVARDKGVSAATVRRRATASLRAVAAGYAQIPA